MQSKQPLSILAAAILGCIYGIVLTGVSILLLYELLGHHGHIGAEHLDPVAARGVKFVSLLLFGGACSLVSGAYLLVFRKRPKLLVLPLALLLIIGSIGQTADMLGTASTASNLIGFGILVLAALPIGLVFLPSQNRTWLRTP